MKKGFDYIADGKRIDAMLQCVVFALMVVAIYKAGLGAFALYIMAIGQILSSIIWIFVLSGDRPRLASGNVIRVVILTTGIVLMSVLVISGSAFFSLSCYMILIGPILGLSYFIITIKEVLFYSKVRKPYYLL